MDRPSLSSTDTSPGWIHGFSRASVSIRSVALTMPDLVELDAAKLHDELLAHKPANARHEASLCPFCVDKAKADAASSTQDSQVQNRVPGIPPADGRSGASSNDPNENTEGGTPSPMSDAAQTMSQETHEALLAKAVTDATKTTDAALQTKVQELAEANDKIATLTGENETLKNETARLNTELDTAQVSQKAAEDKAAQLEQDVAARDTAAQKAKVRQERVDQARNLGIWSDDQITEKAERWTDMAQEQWDDRVQEWQALRPAGSGAVTTDAASAMTGTSGGLTTDHANKADDEKKVSPRRAALGLVEAN